MSCPPRAAADAAVQASCAAGARLPTRGAGTLFGAAAAEGEHQWSEGHHVGGVDGPGCGRGGEHEPAVASAAYASKSVRTLV
jgi:hypothetical protein